MIVIAASDSSEKSKAQADYVCDGIADDVEIQTAIEALPTTGEQIKLTEGTFNITKAIVIDKHVDIIGSGARNTIIHLVSGSNSRMIEYNIPNTITNCQLIKLVDLMLYGNKYEQTSGSEAIHTALGVTDTRDWMLQNVWIESYLGHGVTIRYNHNWLIEHVAIERCDGAGIYLNEAGEGTIFANLIYDNWYGILASGTQIRILSNRIDLSSYEGVKIVANGVYRIANNVITASSDYEEGHSGVYISNCNNVSLIGNFIDGAAQKYAVEENGTSNNNIITSNTIGNFATRGINKLGANTIVKNNYGYVTDNIGTATITAGQTTVSITHGLASTPNRVILTPTADTVNKRYWISAKAASTFTIKINSAATSDISFDWQAII